LDYLDPLLEKTCKYVATIIYKIANLKKDIEDACTFQTNFNEGKFNMKLYLFSTHEATI
jgi:hypothetical protein